MAQLMNSVQIVTGASEGIGRAVAAALADRGFHVIAVGRSLQRLESLAAEWSGLITVVSADLATTHGIENVVANIDKKIEIEGIVHSAGSLVPLEAFERIDPGELTEHFRIHVSAPIALYQALHKYHPIRRMVFIDSYSATTCRLGWAAYSIVKAAAQMAAQCASQELPDTDSIRVFPGAVNTRIVKAILASDTETAAVFAGLLERGEVAEPEEAANFIVALLVDASAQLIRSRETFDFNNATDRTDVRALPRIVF